MNLKCIADILAIENKMQIQADTTLTDVQKEIYKKVIDELKKQIR